MIPFILFYMVIFIILVLIYYYLQTYINRSKLFALEPFKKKIIVNCGKNTVERFVDNDFDVSLMESRGNVIIYQIFIILIIFITSFSLYSIFGIIYVPFVILYFSINVILFVIKYEKILQEVKEMSKTKNDFEINFSIYLFYFLMNPYLMFLTKDRNFLEQFKLIKKYKKELDNYQ